MKVEEIKERIEKIKQFAYDPEVAHGMEDDLYKDVLEAIAKGQRNARLLAEEVLKVRELDFERWKA